MTKYTIQNSLLKAIIKSDGAELCSLIKNDKEYIWQADKSYWGRHAPVLFPFVGKLKNNQYSFDSKSYDMNQHGFARDQEFQLVKQVDTSITFSLKSSPKTKGNYPFDFELKITYSLEENKLITKYEVLNTDTQDIYFSIGGHPAFNCPLEDGHRRSDYSVRLDDANNIESNMLDEGTIGKKTKVILKNGSLLNLDTDLFSDDAIIFDSNPFRKATLVHNESQKEYLAMHFQGFPSLGIWSKNEDSPFVCIEPWYGIADYSDHNGELKKKKGIIRLETANSFECQYAVKIFS